MLKTQVLIVGQGLVGTLLAHEMRNRGISVLVIDNDHQQSASKVAAGLFNPFVFKWITKSWIIDELLPILLHTYTDLEKLLGEDLLHRNGIVRIIGSDKELSNWNRKGSRPDFAKHIGVQREDLIEKEIDRGFGNIPIPSAGWVDIPLMISAYREHLLGEDCMRIERFDHNLLQPGPVCRYKDIECEEVIFCEGAGVDENPFFNNLDFRHTKGEVLDIETEGLDFTECINYGQFIVPKGDGKFRTGTTYNWGELNDVPTDEAKEKILRNHAEFFGSRPTVLTHKAGVRPTAADRRPFLGRHPDHQKLSILNATGSKGVLLAPWCAVQLANHLFENEPLHPEIDLNRIF